MKKTSSTTAHSRFEWSLWLWLASTFLAMFIFAVIITAWAVRHAMISDQRLTDTQSRIAVEVANFPGLVLSTFKEVGYWFGVDPIPLLIYRNANEKPYWIRSFPAPEDSGYLLFSGVDPVAKQSVVQLIKISDGTQVAHWDIDWKTIYEKITSKKFVPRGNPLEARAMNPLLLPSGDIIFNTNNAMVRLSPCSFTPVWVLDEVMHHSNEFDADGTIWAPSVSQDGLSANPWLQDRMRDESLAHVTADGKVLEKRSFIRILLDNGLETMLLGTSGFRVDEEPLHINEINVAQQDSKHWHRGDLLISVRHLSSLFIYRPSTNKIIWHQMGPWMNQHAARFVDDHRISVFNNNVVGGASKAHAFLNPGDINQVLVYDFDTKKISQPFAALLEKARPITFTEGLARLLPDGGLFVEESNYGRQLRFTRDRLLWSRVNDYDAQRIGILSWSRYLTADEASVPLKGLANRQCKAELPSVR